MGTCFGDDFPLKVGDKVLHLVSDDLIWEVSEVGVDSVSIVTDNRLHMMPLSAAYALLRRFHHTYYSNYEH